ncbi:UTP-glucose-1-phosphate uridylyltransferase [Sarcoptes scabiei]|nr:inactive dipeptidyl peptidase 10-like [Sarcoptes scabiei]UXI15202.1 UTP-glucose-1-phosphate uridylyltransferase [Sarcoptes scabiei]
MNTRRLVRILMNQLRNCSIIIIFTSLLAVMVIGHTQNDNDSDLPSCHSFHSRSLGNLYGKNSIRLRDENCQKFVPFLPINHNRKCSQSSRFDRRAGMVRIPSGQFFQGTNRPVFIADGESPERSVRMHSFWLDRHEVSNEKFREFITETAYVTDAERFGDSFVFYQMLTKETLSNVTKMVSDANWWLQVPNASWIHPEGFDSLIDAERWSHPAVHVSWNDAFAYCRWAGKRLPTESEWEYACRSGLERRLFPWGNKERPNDRHLMNIWHGSFPQINTGDDGYKWTAPIDSYDANKFGLKNMVGNVWEWTADDWRQSKRMNSNAIITEESIRNNETTTNGQQQSSLQSFWTDVNKVKKGGSFLCHRSYCYRYRCAARSFNTADSTASNLGFRCAADI